MMDSDATAMTQDTENLVDPPKAARLRGASMRRWVGIIQAGLSVILVGLGITYILIRPSLNPDERKEPYGAELYTGILRLIDNAAAGIWCGTVFIITGVVGIFSSKTKNMVSLYLALCIASLFIALIGVFSSVSWIVFNVLSKQDIPDDCKYQLEGSYKYNEINCCISQYDCGYGYSSASYADYDSIHCKQIREQFEVCTRELEKTYAMNPQMVLYAIMVGVFVLEVFFSIFGACFTCIGLCDCKKKQQPQEERMVYFQLGTCGQMVGSTETSQEIPQCDPARNGLQAPSVMMLNTAGQPVQLANNPKTNANQSTVQMIPAAQVSQIINQSGQMTTNGQVMLVNTSGQAIPHVLAQMRGTQPTPPPSYTLSSQPLDE